MSAQRDFEIAKSTRFSVRVTAGLHHGLVRILDGRNVSVEPLLHAIEITVADGVARQAEQDFGDFDLSLRALYRVTGSIEFVFFFLQVNEPLVGFLKLGDG